jgi:hypothetical protein
MLALARNLVGREQSARLDAKLFIKGMHRCVLFGAVGRARHGPQALPQQQSEGRHRAALSERSTQFVAHSPQVHGFGLCENFSGQVAKEYLISARQQLTTATLSNYNLPHAFICQHDSSIESWTAC